MAKNTVRAAFAAATFLLATPVLAVTLVQAPTAIAHVQVHPVPRHVEPSAPETSDKWLKVGGWLVVVVAFAMIGGISRRRSPSQIVAS